MTEEQFYEKAGDNRKIEKNYYYFLNSYVSYIKDEFDRINCRVLRSEDVVEIENDFTRYLREMKKMISEARTFSDALRIFLAIKHKKAPEVYKAAGIDARHFSKMISNRDYRPTKETVFALAIALELSYPETVEFLKTAGMAFSESSIFDMTIEYFLYKKIYDRKIIDCLMNDFDLPLLPQNWS